MSRPPRILLPHSVVMLTSRVQQGLPFVCTPLMDMILWSALAVAQNLYPVKIISFVVMGNHVHLIILVEDPSIVEGFMERFKCETGHAVNRLLGRRQVSVWCEGYDSPTILTLEDFIEKMAYVYANPVRAHRTDSIGNYQGVSSWQMFRAGEFTKEVARIRRSFIAPLPKGRLSRAQQERAASLVNNQATELLTFTLTPDAWMTAFPQSLNPVELNDRIVQRVAEIEVEMAKLRESERITLPSSHEIISQPIDTPYAPQSFGRRMWCICRDIPRRIAFINFIKRLRTQAREVRDKWLRGDLSLPYPFGLFPPSPPMLANLWPRLYLLC